MSEGGQVVPLWVQKVQDMSIVRLNLWSIKYNASSIRLEGFVRSDDGNMMQKVCSGVICKRMTSNLLFDVSGQFFELTGQIDREFQLKSGMPKDVIEQFATGFPENWAFLIHQSLSTEQRATQRGIENTPSRVPQQAAVPPTQTTKGPIVTFDDDHEMDCPAATTKQTANESRHSRTSNQSKNVHDESVRDDEEEKEDANGADYTFRVPKSQLDLLTPIRWERSKDSSKQQNAKVFDDSPMRRSARKNPSSSTSTPCLKTERTSGAPLASSTPRVSQPPVLSISNNVEKNPPPPSESIFAVPDLPQNRHEKEKEPDRSESVGNVTEMFTKDFLATLQNKFTAATPAPLPKKGVPRRLAAVEERKEDFPPPRQFSDDSRRHNFDGYGSSRYDYRDERDLPPRKSSDETRGSKVHRKRGLVSYSSDEGSSDERRYREKKNERLEREQYERREDYRYDDEYSRSRPLNSGFDRHRDRYRRDYDEPRRGRYGGNSTTMSRSVRFDDDEYSDRGNRDRFSDRDSYYDGSRPRVRTRIDFDDSRSLSSGRNEDRSDRYYEKRRDKKTRTSSWEEDEEAYQDCDRRYNDVKKKLEKSRKNSSRSRHDDDDRYEKLANQTKMTYNKSRMVSSNSEDDRELSDNWDRENQEIMDSSMVGNGLSKRKTKKNRSRSSDKKEESTKMALPKPVKKERKKKVVEVDPESISATRPRRACATPASATAQGPKKVTWPKRDLDKLKRIIEMKKPTGHEEDWKEVTRLLAKDGVGFEEVKQTATNRLKWKETEEKDPEVRKAEEEEEEKKRKKGIAAAVKEDLQLREQMMGGSKKKKDVLAETVDQVEDIQPGDISADESLLGPRTPITYTEAIRKKGGTRRTIVPEPIEDSPMGKSINSSLNKTPRTQAAKQKETENTMKYVQHLTTMQARPGSRANKSYLSNTNKNTSRVTKKKMNMSVDQATEKAMKMIKKGNRQDVLEEEEEEDEDDEEEDSDSDVSIDNDGENVSPVQ